MKEPRDYPEPKAAPGVTVWTVLGLGLAFYVSQHWASIWSWLSGLLHL